ncbi:MAG TPA: type 1 glutamine amidotransferase [Candidatus Eisenbacteria bacterium]|nr:type 1 glutamine amidotransferase [Candidatus Eisenbacteria bacterium]
MRIHLLQHVAHEGPAAIADWAAARGHTLAATRLDRGEPLPAVGDFEMLVVMGGPMSVNDEAAYPWLVAEKEFIAATIREDRRILGVCLGSQMIAAALGKRVHAASRPEIGWFPVRARREAAASRTFGGVAGSFTPFHWHGETFELPEGAIHLAESDACPNQAFEIEFDGGPSRGGALALALQFHMEATEAGVRAMCEAEKESLARGASGGAAEPISPANLLGEPSRYAALRPLLDDVLDRLTAPARPAR